MSLYIKSIGQGDPLVFFHGWGFDHQVWLPLSTQLKKDYRLFLVDLPGFGQSTELSWDDFKRQLLQRLPTQFVLIGWSMGGLYATRLAKESSQVLKLINIASSPYFIQEDSWPGIKKEVLMHFFQQLVNNTEKTLLEFVQLHTEGEQSVLPQKLPSISALKAGLYCFEDWDFRSDLHSFKIPCAFLFGGLDAIIPRTTLKVMQIFYPQLTYFNFKRAGHMPFLSQQEDFLQVLRGLLA